MRNKMLVGTVGTVVSWKQAEAILTRKGGQNLTKVCVLTKASGFENRPFC